MNKETYEQLKEQYIYDISKNGLISTKAIDKKSYLFRSESDKAYKTFLFIIGENKINFLRMVIQEARGIPNTFSDDIPSQPITVLEPLPEPEPIPEPELKEEINQIKEQLQKDNPEIELISNLFYDMIYQEDNIPNWWK